MKELSLEKMEVVEGGAEFTPDADCAFAAAGAALGVGLFFTGAGTLAGLSMLLSVSGALTQCFPHT